MLYRAPANNMMPNAGSGIQPTGEIMTTGRRDELVQELVVLCRKIGDEHQQDRKEEVGSVSQTADNTAPELEMEEEWSEGDHGSLVRKLIPVLLKIVLMTGIFFSIYEVTKQLVFSDIIIWQSHIITIIFASLVAALGAYFPLKKIEILYRRSINELAARKRAQAILRESEERYRQLFEMESDALFLIDDETDQILEVNPAGERLYGFNRKELLLMKKSDLDQQSIDMPSKNGEQEFYGTILFHRKKNGIVFPVEIKFSQLTWYGRTVRLSAIRDITERLNAQKKIENQRAFLRKVIDANPNFIYVKDKENHIILANRVLAEAFNIAPEQMVGKSFKDFLLNSDFAEMIHRDDLSILSHEKERVVIEESFTDAAGSKRWIFTIKVPMKDGEGHVEQLIVVSTDITERKYAEDALKKREMELEIKSRNLEEVNTTLKVLLKKREEDRKEIEEMFLSNIKDLVVPYVEKLKNSALQVEQRACIETLEAHLNDIISPFLTRITSKFINLTPKEIQVASLIKDGKTTKEIAVLLNISPGSVDLHRNHIRSKLGINNQNVNLRSYLLSLP
jgi:PAS domain S-box-containing protein